MYAQQDSEEDDILKQRGINSLDDLGPEEIAKFKEFMKGEGGKKIMQDMMENGGDDFPGGKQEFAKMIEDMGEEGQEAMMERMFSPQHKPQPQNEDYSELAGMDQQQLM